AYRHEAGQWERIALSEAEQQAARQMRFDVPPRHGRPLRIGVVSAELGQHAVAYFLRSWLPHLNPDRITPYLYPTRTRHESQAQVFQDLALPGCSLADLDDAAAVERVRRDGIDILIDVSGHTEHNRLGVFARRAAPVQCHYIGFFATTGLSQMDYFLADAVLIPEDRDEQFVETVWRLPRPWLAYTPLEAAPESLWQAADDGTVCLGSFNNLVKVREDSLDLWARVMQALPEAWLLLKDGKATDAATQNRIREGLTRRGVDDRRVAFAGRTATWPEHMALYDHVDIALDTLPLNSGTTAFDALWMGVPLVTLAGGNMAGRMGAAIVTGMGQADWIAADEREYVAKVVALARDIPRRQALRATQRERMRASALCDGVGLARALEAAFEAMFDRRIQAQTVGTVGLDDLLERGLSAHRQGRIEQAESAYASILEREPDHFDALQLMGALAGQKGQPQQALAYLDRALQVRHDQPEIHYNRGIILQRLDRLEEAVTSYRNALKQDSRHLEARNNLGLVLQQLGRWNEALAAFNEVLTRKPDYAEVYVNKGNVLKDLDRLTEALDCYDQALTLKPDYAEAWYNRG
ncbi:MAG: tetratricopeptide repeat protein, partial [Methylococcaceae bacterium]